MVNSFKRNRSNKGSISTINCIFHKFTNPFKKSKQDSLFTNDTLFEINRYKEQKQQNTQHGILLKPSRHARHGSTQSAIVFGTQPKKSTKHIRHYSHVSASNITVNSEDLTAKEFAEIAGIQILSEDEQEDEITEQKCHDFINQYTTVSTIGSTLDEPHIWDIEFWKHPKNKNHQQEYKQKEMNDYIPILHELKSNNNNYDTFKKGRFEITIGIDHHLNHSLTVPNISSKPVIEWKRKPIINQ